MLRKNFSAKRLVAVSFVLLLMISPFSVSFSDVDAASAARATAPIPTGNSYGYVLTYDGKNVNITNVQAYVGETPTATSGTLQSNTYRSGTTMGSFWKFDSHTGLGPFNSYYAAFNIASGTNADDSYEQRLNKTAGAIAYVLNPNNLKQTLNGTPINHNNSQFYNIMLVVPAVYWVSDSNNLYLSSSPSFTFGSVQKTGMIAYAHTTSTNNSVTGSGATLHPYIALGVYEGSTAGTGDNTKLVSQSGKDTSTDSLNNLRTQALRNTAIDSTSSYQVINYYQWTLYKMMSYTVIGSKNVQKMVGNGNVNTSNPSKTGLADSNSWHYATNNTSKLFLENTWGSRIEVIGDAYVGYHTFYVGNTLGGKNLGNQYRDNGDSLNSSGVGVQYTGKDKSGMEYRSITSTRTDSKYWDFINGINNSNYSDNLDNPGDKYGKTAYYSTAKYKYEIRIGGSNSTKSDSGLSWINNGYYISSSGTNGRLVYVMSESAVTPTTHTITYIANNGEGSGPIGIKAAGSTMLEDNTFTAPAGKAFIGWDENPGSVNPAWSPGSVLDVNNDLILYAIWGTTVTITINNNHTEIGNVSGTVTSSGSPPAPIDPIGDQLKITVANDSTYIFERTLDPDGDYLGTLTIADTTNSKTYTFTMTPVGAESTATYGFYRLIDEAGMEIGYSGAVSAMTLTAEWRLLETLNYNLQNAYLIAPDGTKVTGVGSITKELEGLTITIYPGNVTDNIVTNSDCYIVTNASATHGTSECEMTFDQEDGTCSFVMPSANTNLVAVAKKKVLDLSIATPFTYQYGTGDSITVSSIGEDIPYICIDSMKYYYIDGDEVGLWQTGDTLTDGINSRTLPSGEFQMYLTVTDDPVYADYTSDIISFTVNKAIAAWTALPVAKEGLEYNGFLQELIDAGASEDGTPLYKIGNGEYGTDIPVGKRAGSYTIHFMISATDPESFEDSEEGTLTVLISSPEPKPDRNIPITVSGSGEVSDDETARIIALMEEIHSYMLIPCLIVTAEDSKACISDELLDAMVANECVMRFQDKNVTIDVSSRTLAGLDADDSIVLFVEPLDPSVIDMPKGKTGQVYDITLLIDGSPYRGLFKEPLRVALELEGASRIAMDSVELYYVNGSELEKMDMYHSYSLVLFDAPHLSRYAVIYEKSASVWVNTGGVKVSGDGWKYTGSYYVKSFLVGTTVDEIMEDLGPLSKNMNIKIGQICSSKVLDASGMTIKVQWLPIIDTLLIVFIAIIIGLILYVTFRRNKEQRY